MFSQSLADEVAEEGIYVQALCPGFTYTEFHDTDEFAGKGRKGIPGFLWLKVEDVVNESLQYLGTGKHIVVTNWKYRLIVSLIRNRLTGYFINKLTTHRRGRIAREKEASG